MTRRESPLNLSGDEFRVLGHALVDELARFYDSLPERPVASGAEPEAIRAALGRRPMPETGEAPAALLTRAAELLTRYSVHNGHPRFMGYITSSAAPLGALADLLAAAVNTNSGLWDLAPIATEIETQAIAWLAELVGYAPDAGGIMVSGGNMANLICFFAARRAGAAGDIRRAGLAGEPQPLTLYASTECHTWIQKAADLSGLGTDAIRYVPVDAQQRMRVDALEQALEQDLAAGCRPFLVVATAGTVSTAAIDPLAGIAAVCRRHGVWFHVDGAYGAPAAMLPEAPAALGSLGEADSIALDPHKWLYCPLEAGCALVADRRRLQDAFSFVPEYYRLDAEESLAKTNYYQLGIQNSRGFRALKVWLALANVGREAYVRLIREDIALARRLFDAAAGEPELEALTHNLSITTFRYVPPEAAARDDEEYLDRLNRALVNRLQNDATLFLSNAVVDGRFALRACIVNFRTRPADVDAVVAAVVAAGRALHAELERT